MQHKKVKIGVVQATPALFDIEKTVRIVMEWIEKGAAEGCELLLFPESFIPCYPRGLDFDSVVGRRTEKSRDQWLEYWENSIETSSFYVEQISEAVRKAGIFVALGVTEREAVGGSLHCALLYFDNRGNLIGKHRKLKPTGLERYIWAESDGSTLVSFDTEIGKIGGLICWENYMPLARMSMYQRGVEIYLAPTADSRESWQSTMLHIALEGRCFVLACNQFIRKSDYPEHFRADLTHEPDIMSAGGSVIISPLGEVLAGPLWNAEGLLTAELDFSVLAKSKLDFDVVGHYSRNDVFKLEVVGQPEMMKVR
ncbi:carbon-nitrogen hydrolase family protein [Runella slithyformis]|uniref:Nitrilase n=1 Tax=Runella slithyformis (strain ATCC 29530 / DSM 19594 / LMG 11500 / NCIMB 11436 / LSU 4) TaxID=761193 RepID=A0A7U3ZR11_RUNSL|nr:carbon-nitrogen hydrolase family protein [Runella slithyformis]AEI51785.1 Nitrilase [Runella slithyformis DSM 19594]